MRILLTIVLSVLLGILLFVSVAFNVISTLPVGILALVFVLNRPPPGRKVELSALCAMEATTAWYLLPGLISRYGVTPANFLLADGVAALLLVAPIVIFMATVRRRSRLAFSALVLLILLLGTILVPFIPLGGACTGQVGSLHCENTYGSASWLFICAGEEYATPPGGVSTGLPFLPISLNTTLGDYFFAYCVFA